MGELRQFPFSRRAGRERGRSVGEPPDGRKAVIRELEAARVGRRLRKLARPEQPRWRPILQVRLFGRIFALLRSS